jgi:hypothetical protein
MRVRRVAVLVVALLMLAVGAPFAAAQQDGSTIQNPFTPPPQVQTGPVAAPDGSADNDDGGIGAFVQVLLFGAALAGIAGVFLVIRSDARRTLLSRRRKRRRRTTAPRARASAARKAAAQPTGQELHHRRKVRARAKTKAQRQARRRSR